MCDMACTRQIARFILPPAPPDINVTGESLKPSCGEEARERFICKIQCRPQGRAGIFMAPLVSSLLIKPLFDFPLFCAFSTGVFTWLEFVQENAVITSLALIKTLIYMPALSKNQYELHQKPLATFSPSSIFLHNPDVKV